MEVCKEKSQGWLQLLDRWRNHLLKGGPAYRYRHRESQTAIRGLNHKPELMAFSSCFHSSLSPSWKRLLLKSSLKIQHIHTAFSLSSFACSWVSSARPCPRCSAGLFPLSQQAHRLPTAILRMGRTWGPPAYYDCHGLLLNSFIISLWMQQRSFPSN